jgi:hypothetical protein
MDKDNGNFRRLIRGVWGRAGEPVGTGGDPARFRVFGKAWGQIIGQSSGPSGNVYYG